VLQLLHCGARGADSCDRRTAAGLAAVRPVSAEWDRYRSSRPIAIAKCEAAVMRAAVEGDVLVLVFPAGGTPDCLTRMRSCCGRQRHVGAGDGCTEAAAHPRKSRFRGSGSALIQGE